MNFLDPALFAFYYPKLILLKKNGSIQEFWTTSKSFLFKTICLGMCGVIAIYLILFAYFIIRPDLGYQNYIGLLNIVIASAFIFSINIALHLILYAMGKDYEIFMSTLLSALGAVVFNILFNILNMNSTYIVPSTLLIFINLLIFLKFYSFMSFKKLNIIT